MKFCLRALSSTYDRFFLFCRTCIYTGACKFCIQVNPKSCAPRILFCMISRHETIFFFVVRLPFLWCVTIVVGKQACTCFTLRAVGAQCPTPSSITKRLSPHEPEPNPSFHPRNTRITSGTRSLQKIHVGDRVRAQLKTDKSNNRRFYPGVVLAVNEHDHGQHTVATFHVKYDDGYVWRSVPRYKILAPGEHVEEVQEALMNLELASKKNGHVEETTRLRHAVHREAVDKDMLTNLLPKIKVSHCTLCSSSLCIFGLFVYFYCNLFLVHRCGDSAFHCHFTGDIYAPGGSIFQYKPTRIRRH